jgi:CBS domain containing-hemolysin-like protein
MITAIYIMLVFALVLANGFFVASEFAVYKSALRVRHK